MFSFRQMNIKNCTYKKSDKHNCEEQEQMCGWVGKYHVAEYLCGWVTQCAREAQIVMQTFSSHA